MGAERTTLGQLAAEGRIVLSDGYRTRKDELDGVGVPILRVAEVLDGRIAPTFGDHVSERMRPRFAAKMSRPGDVVVTTKGTVGRCALMSEGQPEFVYSPQLCFFRSVDRSVEPRFLYYWFQSAEFRHQAIGVQSQTDMADYINLADIRAMRVTLPPTTTQTAVANVLGALDDKIESNRRIVAAASESLRSEVAAAYDDDWQRAPLSSLARFVNGGAFTKGAIGSGRMVIRIAELNRGPGGSTIYSDLDAPDDKVARPGDLLMSWSGTLGIHIWTRDEAIVNQHIFKVIPTIVPPWFVFNAVEGAMPAFRQVAADKATTMGHIKRHHLDDEMVPLPSPSCMHWLDSFLGPLWDRRTAAAIEVHTLALLRDALLPELLSGRLRVPEAEELVADAT